MADDTLMYQGADEMVRHLNQLARDAPNATAMMLFHAGEALRSFMVENYLSGQRLHRRTGRLASGWTTQRFGTDTVIVGTKVVYARVHEEGAHGDVQVREHVRRPPTRQRRGEGARAFSKRRTQAQLDWFSGAGGTVTVHAHNMRMNVAAKWYARDTVRFGAAVALRAADDVVRRFLDAH